jgi:acetolactate synthase-1/2/3 large subunit
VVDIPKDITAQMCEFDYPKSIQMRSYNPVVKGHLGQIKKAVQILQEAKRPIIYTGGGDPPDAADKLTELARKLNFPVTNTLMGWVAIRRPTSSSSGCWACSTFEANNAMHYADVILAVGARFDDRVIGNPEHLVKKSVASFISTSIRRRSPSASRSMCLLSAM